jgi:radical SAM superfamily enzyme YgiQ (UPF0313 family)
VTTGNVVRSHSAEWTFSAIYAQYLRRPFSLMSILDDTFTSDARRVRSFCSLFRAWGQRPKWIIRTRVDFVDVELVRLLAEAGCVDVLLGIESADEGVLASIEKKTTLAQVREAVRLFMQHAILVDASFIIGHPSDTVDTIEKTILLAMAMREFGNLTAVGFSTPFPGTPIERHAKRFGIRILERDWRRYTLQTPIYDARGFCSFDLEKAQQLFKSTSFFEAPETLISGNPHREFRATLAHWISEMKQVRAMVMQPVLRAGSSAAAVDLRS